MHTSIIAVASLCAVAFAAPDKRQASPQSISSILAEISSLQAELQPPASLASELTGIPASVTSALNDPTAIASLQSAFLANGPPAWFTSLAPDAQAYVLDLGPKAESILPEIASLEVAAGLTTASGAAGTAGSSSTMAASTGAGSSTGGAKSTGSSSSAVSSGSSKSSASMAPSTASSAGSAASTASSAAKTSSSSGGAAQPTGAIAAGVIAAGSFLGLALAL